ncbi:hypothetical protein KKE60_06320 [Patescibacteria group bacterium]|nr:hypothetical protein [Patescibacteria group bacterium]
MKPASEMRKLTNEYLDKQYKKALKKIEVSPTMFIIEDRIKRIAYEGLSYISISEGENEIIFSWIVDDIGYDNFRIYCERNGYIVKRTQSDIKIIW